MIDQIINGKNIDITKYQNAQKAKNEDNQEKTQSWHKEAAKLPPALPRPEKTNDQADDRVQSTDQRMAE